MTYRPHNLPKVSCEALTKSAKGKPCTLRISSFLADHRCSDGTTVACHVGRLGKGTSTKVSDLSIAYGCQNCHAIIDGADTGRWAYLMDHYPTAVLERILAGMQETQAIMVCEGLIVIPNSELVGHEIQGGWG